MKVDKLSISLAPELGDAVRASASRSGRGLSSWFATAAAAKLRNEALSEVLDQWEAETGAPTDKELSDAAAELHLPNEPHGNQAA